MSSSLGPPASFGRKERLHCPTLLFNTVTFRPLPCANLYVLCPLKRNDVHVCKFTTDIMNHVENGSKRCGWKLT